MGAPHIVIGGGLSGLAAAIRLARFGEPVVIIEQHNRLGGLNSYYTRNGRLYETGLHAISNFAPRKQRHAPLNKLLKQLQLSRDDLSICEQLRSEIRFPGTEPLLFSNDFSLLRDTIDDVFPHALAGFDRLVQRLDHHDPFAPAPFTATREILSSFLNDQQLIEMLLCPLLFYGSSWQDDIDFNQFTILFRAIYQNGLFRPAGTIKDLLDLLTETLIERGATIITGTGVEHLRVVDDRVESVILENGEELDCNIVISTIGSDETRRLAGKNIDKTDIVRLSFFESIFTVDSTGKTAVSKDATCIFFCRQNRLQYRKPNTPVDLKSGVISLPDNFSGREAGTMRDVRITHLANYQQWFDARAASASSYDDLKAAYARKSARVAEAYVGSFFEAITYQDSFTPLTVQRYTGKIEGAVYGSPNKHTDGACGFANMFLAGTDQGYLGIIGAMLSGVLMVNRHILPKLAK